jgi:hypothetical protein
VVCYELGRVKAVECRGSANLGEKSDWYVVVGRCSQQFTEAR